MKRFAVASGEGAIAQLGERYNGIVEVVGSIPSGSTNQKNSAGFGAFFWLHFAHVSGVGLRT